MKGRTAPSVIVIGAGLGGIAAGVFARKAGVTDLTILEKSSGPGGTWLDTRYPGAACDVMSHLYSYSFAQKKDWSRTCAPRDEILAYIEDVVDRFDLRRFCRFDTGVRSAVWSTDSARWTVTTQAGEELSADVLVTAVGLLNEPKYPDWPGLESFTGPVMHTARWRRELSLDGCRVAVVGTGSSAAQVVPALAPQVKHLTVFQREPGWVLPKDDRPFTEEELQEFRTSRWAAQRRRWKLYWLNERGVLALDPKTKRHAIATQMAVDWLNKTVKDPATREKLLPAYPFGCKRPVADRIYYDTFNRPNVDLVPLPVTAVRPHALVTDDGAEHEVDAVVLATGFQATEFLHTVEIIGEDGVRLQEVWDKAGGAEAFLGISVNGFPNLFMLYGPNTNSASNSVIFNLECQARYIASAIGSIARRRGAIEVRSGVQDRYNRWLQSRVPAKTWESGCQNYYHSETGKLVTNWPGSSVLYWAMTKLLRPTVPGLYRTRRAHRRNRVTAP
ncbi:NAD(P)-binding domain-containing protein [Sporichthya brevicatena]|uniref:NAD(P)-binding domain-containing protein n=1 Tax=Sporichthya brevicatena TaxID=171442 RepID=A0ABN1G3X7_9ACTN